MSRLTIDISPEQHKSLKAMAALEGKTIRQYTLERLFPRGNGPQRSTAEPNEAPAPHRLRFPEDEAYEQALREGRRVITLSDLLDKPEAEMDDEERASLHNFHAFLAERAAEAEAGTFSDRTLEDIWEDALREEGLDAE